jgi:hypothetical protein
MTLQERSERWRVPLLVSLVLIAAFYLLAHRPQEGPLKDRWKVGFDARSWKLGKDESRDLYVTKAGFEVYYLRSYRVGPFSLSKAEVLNPTPLGTNTIQTGTFLYQRDGKKELGRVVVVEPKHKFQDGTLREGVLIRTATGDVWMPGEKLSDALVGK